MGVTGKTRADELLEDALERLDSYEVVAELASKPGFVTQLARPRREAYASAASAGSHVVIKTIDLRFANRAMWERYAQLACAHLPRVLDIIELPDALAIVLQYIEGESLEAYVARRGALDGGTIISIMSQLCYAASCLANADIVHRDIKPSNVILSFDRVYLIDPGIARIATASRSQDTTILGSWGYAAPEQLGFAETDLRSDIFSLGRVLGFMATGLSPTSPEFQHQLEAPSPNLRPWVEVWRHACAFDPARRPQSADELEREILRASHTTRAPLTSAGRAGDAPPDRYYTFDVMSVDERGIGGMLTELDGPPDEQPPQAMRNAHGTPPVQRPPDPRSVSLPPTASHGRSATTAPPSGAAGAGRKVAVVCVAAFFGLFALAFFITSFSGAAESIPLWLNIVYGLAMGILGNLLPGWEIANAILGRGVYEDAERPAKLCVKRVLILWAICFGILFATGIVNQLFPVP